MALVNQGVMTSFHHVNFFLMTIQGDEFVMGYSLIHLFLKTNIIFIVITLNQSKNKMLSNRVPEAIINQIGYQN